MFYAICEGQRRLSDNCKREEEARKSENASQMSRDKPRVLKQKRLFCRVERAADRPTSPFSFIPGTLLSPGPPSGSIAPPPPPSLPATPCFLVFSYFHSTASITLSVFSCPLPELRRASEVWQSDKPVTDFPGDCSQTCLSESVRSGSTARLRHQSPINILRESILGRTLRGAQVPSLRLISGAVADF